MGMPIDPRLLEMLACPACHAGLETEPGEAGLGCRGCGRVYPIRDGIPVLLVDEATPPKGDAEGPGGVSPGP
jgi:uncharacterized protein YbaR (Trm112 family)